MFFSIIIALYNRPQEILELLETLTKQTYKQFEVLIVEDGSQKEARHIVEKFTNRLSVRYFFKRHEGQGVARNFGCARAKGDYFIIFDSDCLIPDNYLKIVHSHLCKHPLDAYGGPDTAHSSFTLLQKAMNYALTSPFTTGGIRGNKKHIGHFYPRGFNMGLSRKAWEQTGGYTLSYLAEDIELSMRMYALGFYIDLIPEAKVYHKRALTLVSFFRRMYAFGQGRANCWKLSPVDFQLVYFLPTLFLTFLGYTFLANTLNCPLSTFCTILLVLYVLLLFFHSWTTNKSVKIGFISVITSLIQLTAYGMGFTKGFWKYMVLKNT